jgi:hypothetical protein
MSACGSQRLKWLLLQPVVDIAASGSKWFKSISKTCLKSG